MLRKISVFVSIIFHPVFFPIYVLLLTDLLAPYLLPGLDPQKKFRLFITVAINTIVFPILSLVIMKKLNFVKDIYLRDREERIIPFIALGMFYFWTFMVIRSLSIGDFITAAFLGASISAFAVFFFNLFFKISIHTAGAGYFVAFIFALALNANANLQWAVMTIIIFAGIVGSARWYLAEHTASEIFSGYFIGAFSQTIAFLIIKS
jgi:hypothetical protein